MAVIDVISVDTEDNEKRFTFEALDRIGVTFDQMRNDTVVVTFRVSAAGQVSRFVIWLWKTDAPADQWVTLARAKLDAALSELHDGVNPQPA